MAQAIGGRADEVHDEYARIHPVFDGPVKLRWEKSRVTGDEDSYRPFGAAVGHEI